MEIDSTPAMDLGTRRAQQSGKDLQFDEDRLKIYYNKIFPYKLMFKWMSYNKLNTGQKALASLDEGISSTYFHNREFSFTLANDVYCRYLCFKTPD